MKYISNRKGVTPYGVTVHAAVWIEMRFACNKFTPLSVTVPAAVWIEIKNKE